jgi:NCS1 family nucleobase:cation symporter-1
MASIPVSTEPSDATPARVEAPLTLRTDVPRHLGLRDQFALWGNLGVSLLGFAGASGVLSPSDGSQLTIMAALFATVVGTIIGTLMVSVAGIPGTQTGAPAMALLRGLFGTRLSYLPSVLNIVQLIGWGTFELVVISHAAQVVAHGHGPHWAYVLIAGALTMALTVWPLGSVRLLRRYVTIAMLAAMTGLTIMLLRYHVPAPAHAGWHGVLPATDSVVAVAVSFVPMIADYTRFARTAKAGFWGSLLGYGTTQIWCYVIGIVVILQGADAANQDSIYSAFTGVGLGTLFLGVLVLREADQSFADLYSTAMSVQNLLPKVDRRVLSVAVSGLATLLALVIDLNNYLNFLYLIGSVFVPLFAVFAIDYFVGTMRGGTAWQLGERVRSRTVMLLPWLLGFAVYQLINPGGVSWWVSFWSRVDGWLHLSVQSWMSATVFSFLAAALATLPLTLRASRRA